MMIKISTKQIISWFFKICRNSHILSKNNKRQHIFKTSFLFSTGLPIFYVRNIKHWLFLVMLPNISWALNVCEEFTDCFHILSSCIHLISKDIHRSSRSSSTIALIRTCLPAAITYCNSFSFLHLYIPKKIRHYLSLGT